MYIYNAAKSLGLSFEQEKTKQYALASCADGNEKFPCHCTTLTIEFQSFYVGKVIWTCEHKKDLIPVDELYKIEGI